MKNDRWGARGVVDDPGQRPRTPLGRIEQGQAGGIAGKRKDAISAGDELVAIDETWRMIGVGHKDLTADMDADGGAGEPGEFHRGALRVRAQR
jgi:hypothetical protein